jgi:hypothetical protein
MDQAPKLSTQVAQEAAIKNSSLVRAKELLSLNKSEAISNLEKEINKQQGKILKYESILRLLSNPNSPLQPQDLRYYQMIQARRAENIKDEATIAAATTRLDQIKLKISTLEYDKITIEEILQTQENLEFDTELQSILDFAIEIKEKGEISTQTITSLASKLSSSSIFKDAKSGIATIEHTNLLQELSTTLNTAINSKLTQNNRDAITSFIDVSNRFLNRTSAK